MPAYHPTKDEIRFLDEQAALIGGAHDIARIHEAQPDGARNRSGDFGVGQLKPRVIDVRFVSLNVAFKLGNGGALRIQLLLRNGVLREELGVALQVELRVGKGGSVASESALGLLQLYFEGSRIDFRQKLALFYRFAFFERDAHQLTIDAAADGNGVERRHIAEAIEVNRNICLVGFSHGDRRGTKSPSAAASATTPSSTTTSGWRCDEAGL